ncbi:MAG: hypothetical protein HYX69_07325 [Planctomycetia bacterium]|nr:hypothetical protein [Planctomycetia bacterium]
MSPSDLFGVTVRTIALATVAGAVAAMLAGQLGPLSPLLVGVVLFLGARHLVALAYGGRRDAAEPSR